MSQQVRHESGKLKQSNKKHKGVSKASAKRALGAGRTSETASLASSSKSNKQSATAVEARNKRMHFDLQKKKQKRAEIFLKKRVGSAVGGVPKVIGVVPLSHKVDLTAVLQSCLQDASWHSPSDLPRSFVHVEYAKHKSNVTLLFSERNLLSVMETAKAVDTWLFVLHVDPAEQENMIDPESDSLLSTLRSVGLPETVCYSQGLANLSGKALHEMRKLSRRHFEAAVGTNVRFAEDTDSSMLCRHLTAIMPKTLAWRAHRSFMLCETLSVVKDEEEKEGSLHDDTHCSLKLGGYLRGQPLDVQSLVHVFGATYPIQRIHSACGPFEAKASHKQKMKDSLPPFCVSASPES